MKNLIQLKKELVGKTVGLNNDDPEFFCKIKDVGREVINFEGEKYNNYKIVLDDSVDFAVENYYIHPSVIQEFLDGEDTPAYIKSNYKGGTIMIIKDVKESKTLILKHIQIFEEFSNESVSSDNDAILKKLYSGINNDHSIQRYTMGWKDVMAILDKKFKKVYDVDIQFEDHLVTDAQDVATGKLKTVLDVFARELGFSKQTLSDKDKNPQRR